MSNSLRPHGLYSPWNSPGQDTGVDSLSLLQGIFPSQESNWGLMHCRRILYQLSYQRRSKSSTPWQKRNEYKQRLPDGSAVTNPFTMQEAQVQSLGWEDPLEEGTATHSSILSQRIPLMRSLAGYNPQGHKESDTTEAPEHACSVQTNPKTNLGDPLWFTCLTRCFFK